MQATYSGYSYNAPQGPYPPAGQYYAPQTAFPNAYPNGGGLDIPVYPEYQQWPQQQPQAAGQTPMQRPRQLSERRQPKGGAGNAAMPRPKHISSRSKPPLRSAMKRPVRSTSEPVPGLLRARTNSDSKRTLQPMTRPRTDSNAAKDIPDHMFVSIIGASELRIQNVNLHLVNELRQSFLPMWPHGLVSESTGKDNTWRVNFARNPWSSTGTDAIMVLRMINQLFTRINLAYDLLNTIDTGRIPPRIVYAETRDPGVYVSHFVAYFSRTGRRLTLVDPPQHVGEEIGSRLRTAWPHKIASDRMVEDGIYNIGLKATNFGTYNLDKHLFMSFALQEIRYLGFQLVASVPLAKRGPLGMGSRREVWVFKDTMYDRSRPGTAQ